MLDQIAPPVDWGLPIGKLGPPATKPNDGVGIETGVTGGPSFLGPDTGGIGEASRKTDYERAGAERRLEGVVGH